MTYERDETHLAKFTVFRALARRVFPLIIVNATANIALDKAESEPNRAVFINNDAVSLLAKEACLLNALLIHYSTNYVFDGTKEEASVETNTTIHLGIYGQTKFAAKEALRTSGCRHLILQTSWWVNAAQCNNFIKTILGLTRAGA